MDLHPADRQSGLEPREKVESSNFLNVFHAELRDVKLLLLKHLGCSAGLDSGTEASAVEHLQLLLRATLNAMRALSSSH